MRKYKPSKARARRAKTAFLHSVDRVCASRRMPGWTDENRAAFVEVVDRVVSTDITKRELIDEIQAGGHQYPWGAEHGTALWYASGNLFNNWDLIKEMAGRGSERQERAVR